MTFDKSRAYTAINADELKIGSKCIFGDTLSGLRLAVEDYDYKWSINVLENIQRDTSIYRFKSNEQLYALAYLIEPLKETQYRPFENVEELAEAVKKHKVFIKTKRKLKKGVLRGVSFDARVTVQTQRGLGQYSLKQLFDGFIFADDGSPCGELVEG